MCVVCSQISAKIKSKDVKRNLDAKIESRRDMEYLNEIRVTSKIGLRCFLLYKFYMYFVVVF